MWSFGFGLCCVADISRMFERSPYPLLSLKLLGSICPCLEKEEDGPSRQAAWAVSSIPIRWHRKLRGSNDGGNNNSTASAVGGFISGMFGGSSSAAGGGDTYDPIEGATLSVVDAPSGPQLQVSPSGLTTHRKKSIPLKLIKKVQARKGGIISAATRSGIEILDNTGRELLRFDVLKATGGGQIATDNEEEDWETTESGSGNVEDAEESARDDIIDQLEILVEWERRRQAYIVTLGEDESPDSEEPYVDEYDDEDESTPTSPRSSARKKGALAEKGACSFLVRCYDMQILSSPRIHSKYDTSHSTIYKAFCST